MVTYVSLSPLAADMPVVVWIVKEKRDNGLYDVVYYELPVYTKNYKELNWDFVSGNYKKGSSLILLDGVQDIATEFFGFDAKRLIGEWSPVFDAVQKGSLPSTVKMTYMKDNKKGVMLFCINTNSVIKTDYNETL